MRSNTGEINFKMRVLVNFRFEIRVFGENQL